ncbi:MAG: metallophosphoesterase family protein [Cyanophyceae cyanobacterium]
MSNRRQFLTRFIVGSLGITGLGSLLLSSKDKSSIAQSAPKQSRVLSEIPTQNLEQGTIQIATISDLNGPYGTTDYRQEVHRAIALILQEKPDLVLCGGDMIAGQKRGLTHQQLDTMWASFDQVIAAPLREANIPFLFTFGNHDASNSRDRLGNFNFERDRQAAADYWKAHQANHNSPRLTWQNTFHYPFFWSATFDNLFLTSWDASGFRLQTEQQNWVWNALNSEAAQQANHRIVMGHLPLFVVSKGRNTAGAILANPKQLLTELESHNVDLYISGHHHAYFLGQWQNMDLLHLGNAGDGSRAWLNGGRSPEQTLTWITVSPAPPLITYETVSLKNGQSISLDTLPDEITGFDSRTIRRHP